MRVATAAILMSASIPACAQDPSAGIIAKLERLATQGNAEALYHLGMSYQTGSGVVLDHRRALDYFRRSAALGDPLAAYKLGCFHAGQDDVLPVDEEAALSHKLIAAKAGYALAQEDVARLYASRGDARQAGEWIGRAAAQGTRSALFGYASMHNGKNGLPRDASAVVAYFSLYLVRGDADSRQEAWLNEERAKLSPDERARAERIVAGYKAAPTALTIRALTGQRAALALVESMP